MPGQTVAEGLSLYADALASEPSTHCGPRPFDIVAGYRPGLIGRIVDMHARYYAREAGFGLHFESVVAKGLTEFCQRLKNPRNAIWVAVANEQIVGSIAIDGEDLGGKKAHLRWFFVDDPMRGTGLENRLVRQALEFADAQSFDETHLWTFADLNAARHLYDKHGFRQVAQSTGSQWGKSVTEQHLVRRRFSETDSFAEQSVFDPPHPKE